MKHGALIKNAREALGLDRRGLALELDMNPKSIGEFETDHQKARRTVLMAIEVLLRRKGWTDMADAFFKQTGGRP